MRTPYERFRIKSLGWMLAALLLVTSAGLILFQNSRTGTNNVSEKNIVAAGYELGYVLGRRQRVDGNTQSLPPEELSRLAAEAAPAYGYNSADAVNAFAEALNSGYDAGLNDRSKRARLFQD